MEPILPSISASVVLQFPVGKVITDPNEKIAVKVNIKEISYEYTVGTDKPTEVAPPDSLVSRGSLSQGKESVILSQPLFPSPIEQVTISQPLFSSPTDKVSVPSQDVDYPTPAQRESILETPLLPLDLESNTELASPNSTAQCNASSTTSTTLTASTPKSLVSDFNEAETTIESNATAERAGTEMIKESSNATAERAGTEESPTATAEGAGTGSSVAQSALPTTQLPDATAEIAGTDPSVTQVALPTTELSGLGTEPSKQHLAIDSTGSVMETDPPTAKAQTVDPTTPPSVGLVVELPPSTSKAHASSRVVPKDIKLMSVSVDKMKTPKTRHCSPTPSTQEDIILTFDYQQSSSSPMTVKRRKRRGAVLTSSEESEEDDTVISISDDEDNDNPPPAKRRRALQPELQQQCTHGPRCTKIQIDSESDASSNKSEDSNESATEDEQDSDEYNPEEDPENSEEDSNPDPEGEYNPDEEMENRWEDYGDVEPDNFGDGDREDNDNGRENDDVTIESGEEDKEQVEEEKKYDELESEDNFDEIEEQSSSKTKKVRLGRDPNSYRKYKFCPVSGCPCKQPLKKLSNHLTRQHPTLTHQQRKRCLKAAKVAYNPAKLKKHHQVVIAGQPTLHFFTSPPRSPSPDTTQKRQRSTMHFLRFPVEAGTEIYKLYTFLRGKDGGEKTDKDATKNTTDVSKFLRFCGSKLNWDHLLDISKIESFLSKVKEAGCSADTERKYILAIHHALNYLKLCRMDSRDHQRHSHIVVVQERLLKWRKVLKKATGEDEQKRVEVASVYAKVDLDKVEDLDKCEDLWQDYSNAVAGAKKKRRPHDATLTDMTTAIAATIIFKNMQRSGVAATATLDEYNGATKADGCIVIRVRKHKTSRQGATKLVVEGKDMTRLHDYVSTLRPLMDPTGSLEELFILPGPTPFGESFNQRLTLLSKHYQLNLPTCTRMRKAGASTAASTLDRQGVNLMAKQMAHSTMTAERWYQMKDTTEDSICAFKTIQKLRVKDKPQPEEDGDKSSGRMKWSDEQTELVRSYFKDVIKAEGRAMITSCELCAKSHPLLHNIPPQKIQDKVKTLIRQKQRLEL